MKLSISIEKSAARIIISTLVLLVVIGVAFSVTPPSPLPPVPGHDITQTGNQYGWFANVGNTLVLQLPNSDATHTGLFEIKSGNGSTGLLLRQAATSGTAGLLLGTPNANKSALKFSPTSDPNAAEQIVLQAGQVIVESGQQFCVGGGAAAKCVTDLRNINNKKIFAEFTCSSSNCTRTSGSSLITFTLDQPSAGMVRLNCPANYTVVTGGVYCYSGQNDLVNASRPVSTTQWAVSCIRHEVVGDGFADPRETDSVEAASIICEEAG